MSAEYEGEWSTEEYLVEVSKSLLSVGREFVPEMMTQDTPAFHFDMDQHLRDLKQRYLLIVAPRHHAKSSLGACLLVLWHIFLEVYWRKAIGLSKYAEHTPRFVVIISKTRSEAVKRLGTIKAILGDQGEYSERFREVFGNYGEDTARKWTEGEVELKDGTIIKAIGTGQQSRGLKNRHLRPTLIVPDDPEDENNTKTPEAMIRNRRWLLQSILPSLDVEIGRVCLIGTPLNTQCLVVKLQEATGWRTLWYQHSASKNTQTWYDSATRLWTEKPGVLWPRYITRKHLFNEKKTADSLGMVSSYYREWEATVVGDEDQIFRPEYIQNWTGTLKQGSGKPYIELHSRGPEKFDPPLLVPVLVFTGVDPASSTSDTADRTSIVNIAVDASDRIYVLPEWVHERMAPDKVVEAIAFNHRMMRPTRGIVEVSVAFEFVWVYLGRDFKIWYMKDKPIEKKKGVGGRLEGLQPIFAQKRIFLAEGYDSVPRQQLLSYPRGADDWMDALEKAVRIRSKPQPGTHETNSAAPKRKVFDWKTC